MSEVVKKNVPKANKKKNQDLENYFANTIIPQLFIDGNLILKKFTPPAMKQFSLTDEDINRDIRDVKDNFRFPTLIENINEVIETGEILEKEVQTTDEKWFQMNILPYTVFKENRTNGVIITFVDITKRIKTIGELEKLNSEYNTLLDALSHDIRQPLSAIVLLSDALLNAYHKQNTPQFIKYIDTLKSSSNAMRELVKDFIAESEEQPELEGEPIRVNIENIAQDVIISLKSEIFNKGITISTDFQTSEIIFSRNNLRSILYNLLRNSIKYKKADKPLKIQLSTVRNDDHVLLQVKDNGIGIAEEHQEAIFKRSTRVSHKIEGTGMGLYIIKRIMENNGGSIEVESQLGKGSTFSVYFPV
ncbi:sensor histidine kinase [Salinimicrobium xinjiangense]|uniref:sensor histidine kinase n=1 Tax=Salinimicrobium xinjiangense TaxID=438596 RepID=UPI000418F54A|nr:ATP-binding protein [Salinimicrobium xinjiangense]